MLANGKHQKDETLEEILSTLLANYRADHAKAKIEARRQYSFSVFVRIIDPDFGGIDWFDRLDVIWPYLEPLSLVARNHLGHLLLLTPAEAKKDPLNVEFEKLKASKRVIRPGKFRVAPDDGDSPSKKTKASNRKRNAAHKIEATK